MPAWPAFFLLLLSLPGLIGAQSSRSALSEEYPGFDVRYGIAPGADLAGLVGKATLISMSAEKFRDPETGERRLIGYGDAQGVYDVPIRDLLAVLDDPAGAVSYSPRLLEARIEEEDGPRVVLYQDIGIVFLGFKVSYRFRAEQIRDDLSPSEVGYRVRLLESLDGHFFEAYTSWYLAEVLVDGRQLVYIRNYTRPGLRKPALGMEFIVRRFTPGELRSTMERVVKEARRRAASADQRGPGEGAIP
jgi:hypothetical protein